MKEDIEKYKKDCDLLELTDDELISEAKATLIDAMNRKSNGFRRPEKVALVAIENLIARNKELEEDNYAYHQLMQMQNKREYRSKFLKDFKAEYGENVMPDYDEIYKRYDKMKKELSNSIPISKVEKKINYYTEELKNPLINSRTIAEYSYGIKVLKELQEGDK